MRPAHVISVQKAAVFHLRFAFEALVFFTKEYKEKPRENGLALARMRTSPKGFEP